MTTQAKTLEEMPDVRFLANILNQYHLDSLDSRVKELDKYIKPILDWKAQAKTSQT